MQQKEEDRPSKRANQTEEDAAKFINGDATAQEPKPPLQNGTSSPQPAVSTSDSLPAP